MGIPPKTGYDFLPGGFLTGFLSGLGSLVLPDRCMACRAYLQAHIPSDPLDKCFCPSCLDLPLPLFQPPFCTCCGHLFDEWRQEGHLCEDCLKHRPAITCVRAAFAYEGVIRTAVTQLKYTGRLRLVRPLEQHLFNAFERYFAAERIDLILPIPLHPSRAWERQFNQAVLLVRRFPRLFYRRFGRKPLWQVRPDLLVRIRATVGQTGLDQKAREKNLKGAFTVMSPSRVKGRQVLLVDDVFTSGATCRAAAQALVDAGAGKVAVLVLARA